MQKVCVIGAGVAGLTTIKALRDKKIAYDCFEQDEDLGGVWCYHEDTSRFSVYQSCHTIACKYQMSLADFPMPDDYPEYPSNRLMLQYLQNYAKAFNLYDTITFNTAVKQVLPMPNGKWHVFLSNGTSNTYDAVIVGTGQFYHPKYPKYAGQFDGKTVHSAYYRNSEPYRNKNVLVVGLGNSGVDIACELAGVANKLYLSTRESAYVIPKYILGVPFLKYADAYEEYFPFIIRQYLTRLLCWFGRGKVTSYGLPKPTRQILLKNPTVSSQLLDRVGHGDIMIKPGINQLLAGGAEFSDGSKLEDIDAIIYSTGFTIQFPFFDPQVITFEPGKYRNYHHVVNIDHDNLYFVGMINPLGGYPPLFELQAKWLAKILNHDTRLPNKQRMQDTINAYERTMCKRYGKSHEPMIKVDYFRYKILLQRLLKPQHNWLLKLNQFFQHVKIFPCVATKRH